MLIVCCQTLPVSSNGLIHCAFSTEKRCVNDELSTLLPARPITMPPPGYPPQAYPMYPSLLHYTSLYCAINFRCHQLFCLFSRRGWSLVRRIWSKYRQEVCLAHVQTPRPGLNCVDNDLIKLCAFWLHYLRVSLLNCSTVGCVVRRQHTQPTHHRTYLSSFLTSLAQTFQT